MNGRPSPSFMGYLNERDKAENELKNLKEIQAKLDDLIIEMTNFKEELAKIKRIACCN